MSHTITDGGSPPALTPREAAERWLAKRRADLAEHTVADYWYRLKQFVEWCEANDVDTMRELTPWRVDTFDAERRAQDLAPITLRNHQRTIKDWLAWCSEIGIAPEGVAAPIGIPEVDREHHVDSTRLTTDAAQALIEQYRDAPQRASPYHVILEVLWYVGCRAGGLRGLDVSDVDRDAGVLEFRHRPETDTPLKNGGEGERDVGVGTATLAVIGEWLDGDRPDVHDDHGRRPLLTTREGRMARTTLRNRCYHATVPCRYRDCPHGEDPPACEWNAVTTASKCPSSRSPHQVRTGSITWQLNRDVPIEVVARRVNASVRVLRKHYDKPTKREAFEARERAHLPKLEFDTPEADDP